MAPLRMMHKVLPEKSVEALSMPVPPLQICTMSEV